MELARERLTVLLNTLYATDTGRISVSHPSSTVGDLLEIDLGDPAASTVRMLADEDAYADRRDEVARTHGEPAVDELPRRQSYVGAFLAGGLLEPPNAESLRGFLDTHGGRDLTAGHRPVLAGFDTNLLPWRIAEVLDLDPDDGETVNGFALATGVRDELDWDYKRGDTDALERAFGEEFGALWNQPAGRNREGRLGETYYRALRDHRYAEELQSGTGDERIVQAHETFESENRKEVLLFSNDRDFVERARSARVKAERVELPSTLPRRLEGTWGEIEDTLYVLTVLFGVLELPKVTLYGVWRGKGGQAWHDEQLRVECRSPAVRRVLERDAAIVDG